MCVTDLGDLCCCCCVLCVRGCLTAVSAIRLVASAEIPPWVEDGSGSVRGR